MIKEKELTDFCDWFKSYFGDCKIDESVFITCMTGHFHSYKKAMRETLSRMVTTGLVKRTKNKKIKLL